MEYATTDHLTKEKAQEQGSFYTPQLLSEKMAQIIIDDMIKKYPDGKKPDGTFPTVLDPCVGKGNLLLAVKNKYKETFGEELPNDNLFGMDIDETAIKYCNDNFKGGHFIVGDILKNRPASDLEQIENNDQLIEWWETGKLPSSCKKSISYWMKGGKI